MVVKSVKLFLCTVVGCFPTEYLYIPIKETVTLIKLNIHFLKAFKTFLPGVPINMEGTTRIRLMCLNVAVWYLDETISQGVEDLKTNDPVLKRTSSRDDFSCLDSRSSATATRGRGVTSLP